MALLIPYSLMILFILVHCGKSSHINDGTSQPSEVIDDVSWFNLTLVTSLGGQWRGQEASLTSYNLRNLSPSLSYFHPTPSAYPLTTPGPSAADFPVSWQIQEDTVETSAPKNVPSQTGPSTPKYVPSKIEPIRSFGAISEFDSSGAKFVTSAPNYTGGKFKSNLSENISANVNYDAKFKSWPPKHISTKNKPKIYGANFEYIPAKIKPTVFGHNFESNPPKYKPAKFSNMLKYIPAKFSKPRSDNTSAILMRSHRVRSVHQLTSARPVISVHRVMSAGQVSATEPYIDPATPSEVTGHVGMTVILPCFVNNLGQRSVSWVRHRDIHVLTVGGLTFTNDDRFHTSHEDGSNEWSLSLRSPRMSDSGFYECQVNTKPIITRHIFLRVLEPRAILSGGDNLYVKVGSSFELNCTVVDAPFTPKFVFYHQDKIVFPKDVGTSVSFSVKNISGTILRINSASEEHSGTFTCSPSGGVRNTTVIVHVIKGYILDVCWRLNSSNSSSSYPRSLELPAVGVYVHLGVFACLHSPSVWCKGIFCLHTHGEHPAAMQTNQAPAPTPQDLVPVSVLGISILPVLLTFS